MTSTQRRTAMRTLFGALAVALLVVLLPAVPAGAAPGTTAGATPATEHADPTGGSDQAPAPDRSAAERPDAVEGELLVRFQPTANANERAQVRARHGLEKIQDLPLDGLELVRTTRPGGPPEHAAAVAREHGVRYAEPNHLWYPAGHEPVVPDDPQFGSLWGLRNTGQTGGTAGADIDATRAWSVTSGSEQVVVGVLDTGTMVDHPDLAENIWLNVGELPVPKDAGGADHAGHDANGDGVVSISDYAEDPRVLACGGGAPPVPSDLLCAFANGADTDGNGYADDILGWDFFNGNNVVYDELDGDGHGTHVAGTIAAVTGNGLDVSGVSDARIMPLKFIGPDGGGTAEAILAIDYAIENGADLTNNSWGGPTNSPSLKAKIEDANQAGQLFVAAAGNGDSNGNGIDNDLTPFFPASYDNENIISVAATDHADKLAGFSNFGTTTVDLGAPGVSILSTVPGFTKAVLVGPDTGAPVNHRIAYHSFGLEGVSTNAARRDLLSTTLGWMGVGTADPVLLVDDDGGASSQGTYQATLNALGYSAVTTHTVPTGGNGPTAAAMAGYDAVIWLTGATYQSTLTSTDQARLTTYLQGGGNLALFGVDIGYDLTGNGSTTNAFYRDVLRTAFIAERDGNFRLRAQQGTPYGSLPNLVLTDAAFWSDAIAPRSGAVAGLRGAPTAGSNGTSMAAPHVAGAAAQVHASYPSATHLEVRARLIDRGDPISSLATKTVSGNRLDLANALDTDGPPVLSGVSVTPSGFDPGSESATLGWTQNEPGAVTIEVTADGALSPARSLGLGPMAAGAHQWEWDGTISGGAQADGLYEVTVIVGDALGGHSQAGAPVTATAEPVEPTVPSPPLGVGAVPGDQQAVVSWSVPSDDGGSPVTGYTATATPGGAQCTTTTALSCSITGLTNGTTYSVVVRAANAVGTSEPSDPATVTPAAATVPSPPLGVGAVPGDRQAVVSWSVPSDDGGSPVTGYTATATPGGAQCTTTTALSCSITGLTNGTTYSVVVRAANGVGTSEPSDSATVTPATVPSKPRSVTAQPGNQSAVVSWAAPSSTGGSSITGYRATASPGGRSCTTTGSRSCTITGLTNGTAYSVVVRATNAAGTSAPSDAATVTPRTVPSNPRSVAGDAGDRSVAVSWAAPSSTGGSSITGYRATASPGGRSCTTTGSRSCTITGLNNGTRYTFTVRASNAAGSGPVSDASLPRWPTSPTQFGDVPAGAFFYGPVHWLAHRGVTTGCTTSAFCPLDDVTRAQTATFIWRLAGSPSPSGPAFADVPPGSYFADATRWMRANGLTTGVGGTNHYEPYRATSRAELVTLLYRFAGEPAQAANHGFADVPPGSYFEAAVAWAKHHGITTGVGGTNLFEPHRTVTRAEAAAFLVRYATTPAARGSTAVPIRV